MEKLWKKITQQDTHLHYFPTFEALTEQVEQALLTFTNIPEAILTLCGLQTELAQAAEVYVSINLFLACSSYTDWMSIRPTCTEDKRKTLVLYEMGIIPVPRACCASEGYQPSMRGGIHLDFDAAAFYRRCNGCSTRGRPRCAEGVVRGGDQGLARPPDLRATWTSVMVASTPAYLPQHVRGHGHVVLV